MTDTRRTSLAPFLLAVGVIATCGAAVFCWLANTKSIGSNQPNATSPADSPTNESNQPAVVKDVRLEESDLALHPQLKDLKYDASIRQIAKREDPVVDGWDTERFNELADKQLKLVGKMLADSKLVTQQNLTQVSSEDFKGALRPESRQNVLTNAGFSVFRTREDSPVAPLDFESALLEQAKLFASAETTRFKFKTIRVELNGSEAKTICYFQIIGLSNRPWKQEGIGEVHGTQVNSTWHCQWNLSDPSYPRLTSIEVTDYEEVFNARRPLFSDCTQSQLQGIDALEQQLIYGRDHWYANLEASIGVEGRGNGLSIGDANGDGLEDLYICQPAALPNKLLMRRKDGSFHDASARAGVDWLDSSRGALFVDLDNDGDQDLVVSLSSDILLHENDGNGVFHVRRRLTTNSRLFSINAIDYDHDGKLDLYACGYSGANQIRPEDIFASPVPYHDANNGAENVLLRQTDPWTFEDVTKTVGLDQNNLRFSLASCWDDMDLDGDLDLYVANDFGRNNLYRNDNGRFTDIASAAGVEDIGPGMSCTWGDYNNDGLMDLYVSNMFSSAGSRITHTPLFKPRASQQDLSGFQRHARGNTLFQNNGDGTFTDQAVSSGTSMGRWAWGSHDGGHQQRRVARRLRYQWVRDGR